MRLQDLTRISFLNLKRRKLRTFFTLLGVIIGTSSIVLMMSLGIASSESLKELVESSGGATEIKVTGISQKDNNTEDLKTVEKPKKKPTMTDTAVHNFQSLPYVKTVAPSLSVQVGLKQRGYTSSYVTLQGVTREYLEAKNIEIAEGKLPEGRAGNLELFFGNASIVFFEKGKKGGYWETGELPDIKVTDGGFNIIWEIPPEENAGFESSQESLAEPQTKKSRGTGVGLMAGGPDGFNDGAWNVYTDLESLKSQLKKIYGNGQIPGQPTDKRKKVNREWVYNEIAIYVDDIKHVEETQLTLKEMGYDSQSNLEFRKSIESTQRSMQLLLGGIGSISLFVATIGIVNTMMMSTYERQKEIGVYKVLGCKLTDIMWLFLFEASLIGFIGGMCGLLLSGGISFLLNTLGSGLGEMIGGEGAKVSIITVPLALLGLSFATGMGALAGYFPARRATKLSALAAIKTE